ncbi:MAG TPA: squalene synthase HpnC [Acidiphilium sp.]|nr:MAG: squalene synthase HpnC [Acidiphilium sp. 21-60-14]OYV91298.1 MAG: squalene synthase HpnC [Acidiphilium sp. 37-60-79]OZB40762.1 MAG: squalene synthase HpnC [Acidiphilium sp. 34-60-192]HQT88830.1 squalene synthase HpnC [Acidiphilium sp.]HQU23736.1 squalene synthase HpnC [Acidiphilium sp.]
MTTPISSDNVELWSGKDRGDENFPVGVLIHPKLRPHVHAFYSFARNADDIADHADLTPEDKITRLNRMDMVLSGAVQSGSPSASRLRESLAQMALPATHARELLIAFRQDATKSRYASWQDLMEYCRFSAAPVGRFVLDLHREDRASWPASDALCAALQVLNHLQDCADDWRSLKRCYLPTQMLTKAGISVEALTAPATSAPLRAVFDDMLERTAELNRAATALAHQLRSRRMRLETGVITNLAERLHARLCRQDPLAGRVKLRKSDFLAALMTALPRLA